MDHFAHSTSEDSDSNDCEDSSEYESDYSDREEPLIWMTSCNGNEKPFYKLYSFHLDYCKSGKNYWKCDKCKVGCKARIHTVAGSNEFLRLNVHSPLQAHNHDVNLRELTLARARSSFKEVGEKCLKTTQIYKAKCLGENRRSARVNSCIGKLRRLLTNKYEGRSTKLENVDILEMTVAHMEKLEQKNEQLLQQIQMLSQTNNGQLTNLNSMPEVMSPVTNATFDAYSRMRMTDTLTTANGPEALLKDMRGSLNNTHMNFPFNLIPNFSTASLTPLLSATGSESEVQQRFFQAGMPIDCFRYFPEPKIPELPLQATSNVHYDHHLSFMQQFQPTANFQSSPEPVSSQLTNMQLLPGFMPGATIFSASTGPSASVPMITPSWETHLSRK